MNLQKIIFDDLDNLHSKLDILIRYSKNGFRLANVLTFRTEVSLVFVTITTLIWATLLTISELFSKNTDKC